MAQSNPTLGYQPLPNAPTFGWRLGAWILSWVLTIALLSGVAAWRYGAVHDGRVFDGVSVNGVSLSGLTPAQAERELVARLPTRTDERLTLVSGDERWAATHRALGIRVDAPATVAAAMELGRRGDPLTRLRERFALWRGDSDLGLLTPRTSRDPATVEALLAGIANEIARDPVDARLIVEGLTVRAIPAEPGRQLDLDATRERLLAALDSGERRVELVVTPRTPHIVGAEAAAERARALIASPLMLTLEQLEYREGEGGYAAVPSRRQWVVDRARLAELLRVYGAPLESGQYTFDVRLDLPALRADLEALAPEIEREPRDARFDFNPATGAIWPLVVSQEGLRLDVDESLARIESAMAEGRTQVELAVDVTPPTVSTADAAVLDVSQVAVQGYSDYSGSSDEREVNIGVAASQYHGVVIPPGGLFSFNDHLGWVVDATGYEEGYIISGNETRVDVGGGVCQVSTTMFRAAFNAGFEIVERHPHAYRVPYYENGSPLGFDATIFSPVVDFKFRNNTDNFYLIGVVNDPGANTLQIRLFGPPTGRDVELISEVTEVVPHGPDIYIDDPTLPPGEVRQVDWSHDGATIRLTRIIRDLAGNEIGRDDFWSTYRPWQAKFLVGTGGS